MFLGETRNDIRSGGASGGALLRGMRGCAGREQVPLRKELGHVEDEDEER